MSSLLRRRRAASLRAQAHFDRQSLIGSDKANVSSPGAFRTLSVLGSSPNSEPAKSAAHKMAATSLCRVSTQPRSEAALVLRTSDDRFRLVAGFRVRVPTDRVHRVQTWVDPRETPAVLLASRRGNRTAESSPRAGGSKGIGPAVRGAPSAPTQAATPCLRG